MSVYHPLPGCSVFLKIVSVCVLQTFLVSSFSFAAPISDETRSAAAGKAPASIQEDSMLAPISVTVDEQDLRALLGSFQGTEKAELTNLVEQMVGRVETVKRRYAVQSMYRWFKKVFSTRGNDPLLRRPDVIKRAYLDGMKNTLTNMRVRQKGSPLSDAEAAEVVQLVARISADADLDAAFNLVYEHARRRFAGSGAPEDVGAIRQERVAGVTAREHGARFKNSGAASMELSERQKATLNGVLGTLIGAGEAYAIMQGMNWRKLTDDVSPREADIDVPVRTPDWLAELQSILLSSFLNSDIKFVVVKGFAAELQKRGVAQDVIFHYGERRKQAYIDEDILRKLLALPNGLNIVVQGYLHEVRHIQNPQLPENEVERVAPTGAFRAALREILGPAAALHIGPGDTFDVGAVRARTEDVPALYVYEPAVFSQDLEAAQEELSILRNRFAANTLTPSKIKTIAEQLFLLSLQVNRLASVIDDTRLPNEEKSRFTNLILAKSLLARDVAGAMIAYPQLQPFRVTLEEDAVQALREHLAAGVVANKLDQDDADMFLASIQEHLPAWLRKDDMPQHMLQGLYRGILDGRWSDLVYAFGKGWVDFGTAGVRNENIQSSTPALVEQGLNEFEQTPLAPTISGPNLINAVTLLQIKTTLTAIMKDLQAKIALRNQGDPRAAKELQGYDPRFLEGIGRNRVVIAYDSRLHGRYFAKMLAASFLLDGVEVDLFEHAAGVPHLAWAAYDLETQGRQSAAFGLLISASHSEAYFNGLKVYLGYQMSQVDKSSKEMIKAYRNKVEVPVMDLELAGQTEQDFDNIIGRNESVFRWISEHSNRGELNKPRLRFFAPYYATVAERSPLRLLSQDRQDAINAAKEQTPLKVLYTAFYGVGARSGNTNPADDGADFKRFLEGEGFSDIEVVDKQTGKMNGRFPGHQSPDPGIVQGWTVNLLDYLEEHSGRGYAHVDAAVEMLNEIDVAVATDPDIDRAGIMIGLPSYTDENGDLQQVAGNIKAALLAAVSKRIADPVIAARVYDAIQNGFRDKMLLTANDAWTFMLYWKLALMERAPAPHTLDRKALYIIEKSHVTTPALEKLARYYREEKPGTRYQVYVIDTYVGFTEIGKKARDIFAFSKIATDPQVRRSGFEATLALLEKANRELKSNVPPVGAGLTIIDRAIELIRALAASDGALSSTESAELDDALYALSHAHILAGVEESNGYGELGRWDPDQEKVVDNHISDKDGSLAAFEFLELATYGQSVGLTPYAMYRQMNRDLGVVGTVNNALYHPSLDERLVRIAEMAAFEKILAFELQKRLDLNMPVTLFNNTYRLTSVVVYRDGKYDNFYYRMPEEGVRLVLEEVATGTEAIVTYRPSGTGDSSRAYNWFLGRKPGPAAQTDAGFEAYRKEVDAATKRVSADFFENLMKSLKAAGLPYAPQVAVFDSVVDKPAGQGFALTPLEEKVYTAVQAYAKAMKTPDERKKNDPARFAAIRQASAANRAAWSAYLASPEVREYLARARPEGIVAAVVNGVEIRIPRAAAVSWQAGLVDYLVSLVERGRTADYTFTCADQEIAALVTEQLAASEAFNGLLVGRKLTAPLNAQGNAAMAARYLKGGYKQDGWGVAEGAAVNGSMAIGSEGDQGYYVDKTNIMVNGTPLSGKEVFVSTVNAMHDFFVRRAQRIGKPIRFVIKPGIGGQHTPFQGAASFFELMDVATGKVVGEYELGKDYAASIQAVLDRYGADWDQIAVIPSSKSGSTDETMLIFTEVFYQMLKHIAAKEGLNGQAFADSVLAAMHAANYTTDENGVEKEVPAAELFKKLDIAHILEQGVQAGAGLTVDQAGRDKIIKILGVVLGNMFFETTDRPADSRLSAFIRNSGLDVILGADAPGFGAMFDNVGGRWTGDLHMMAFLAYHNLNAAEYWQYRYDLVAAIRQGKNSANELAERIVSKGITNIALVLPDELFWFGKSIEQNFNESIWQQGFANLVAVKESQWAAQSSRYTGPGKLVIDLSRAQVADLQAFDVFRVALDPQMTAHYGRLAHEVGGLMSLFYGTTSLVGDRLIARALLAAGYAAKDVDMSDLDNPATKIVQQNLYLRQPYVELGKGLLEKRLANLQAQEAAQPGAIKAAEGVVKQAAAAGAVETNIPGLALPRSVTTAAQMADAIRKAMAYAAEAGRTFVPMIYLEGEKFTALRDELTKLGIAWVLQGTGDQHINYQQVLSQPKQYLPFIVSMVADDFQPSRPAVGFAKGYLNHISPNLVRDYFAEASYQALTTERKDAGGEGVFLRLRDTGEVRGMFEKAFQDAATPVRTETPSVQTITKAVAPAEEARLSEGDEEPVTSRGAPGADETVENARDKETPDFNEPERAEIDLRGGPADGVAIGGMDMGRYIDMTTASIDRTVSTVAITPEATEKGVVIVVTDTGMARRGGQRAGDMETGAVSSAMKEAVDYLDSKLGDKLVINIRGSGADLLDQVNATMTALAAKNIKLRSIIVLAGDETMQTVTGANATVGSELAKIDQTRILSVEDGKGKFIPVAALYELAVIIGFSIDTKIERCLASIGDALDANGNPLDPKALLTEKIIRIIPKIRPVNPSEHVEAQKAARAALSSL